MSRSTLHLLSPAELQRVAVVDDVRARLDRLSTLHRSPLAPAVPAPIRRRPLVGWLQRAMGGCEPERSPLPWVMDPPQGLSTDRAETITSALAAAGHRADVERVEAAEIDVMVTVDLAADIPTAAPATDSPLASGLRPLTLAERSNLSSSYLAGTTVHVARVCFARDPELLRCEIALRDLAGGLLLTASFDASTLAEVDLAADAWSALAQADPWCQLGATALATILDG